MRLDQIDLNLLVAFDVIHAERNLTRAAAKLHLTQPTMSHALGRLRDLFGDPLFTRGPGGMRPTPFAERLAGPIRRALDTLERELSVDPSFDPGRLQRRFQVGLRDVLESIWLPPLAAVVERSAPGVDLFVRTVRPRRIVAELSAGAVDLVADVLVPVNADIHHQPLMVDRLVALIRKGHPLLGRRRTLDLDAFLAMSHLRVSSSPSSLGLEDLALDQLGHHRRIAVRCQGHRAAVDLVATSDLALTLPSSYLPLVTDRRIRVVELPFEVPPVAVHLYWHATTDLDPACRWLRERLVEVVASSTPSMIPDAPASVDDPDGTG